jgi:hypothetical protein
LRRSVRGRPNCGKTLLSPNQVIADLLALMREDEHCVWSRDVGSEGWEVDAECWLGVGAGRHE